MGSVCIDLFMPCLAYFYHFYLWIWCLLAMFDVLENSGTSHGAANWTEIHILKVGSFDRGVLLIVTLQETIVKL